MVQRYPILKKEQDTAKYMPPSPCSPNFLTIFLIYMLKLIQKAEVY